MSVIHAMTKPILVLCALVASFLLSPTSWAENTSENRATAKQQKPYTFAILSFRAKETSRKQWQPLIDHLQQQLPNIPLQLRVYFYDELNLAVNNQEVDFVLTQPANYVLLTYRSQLSSPLASLINLEGSFATDKFGGVIFTRANNHQINDIQQLKGKVIATSDKQSLGSYQMQAFELLEHGINLDKDATLLETGQPQTLAVEAVLSGKADVGFVRTGVLEHMAQQGKLEWHRIKLIGAQKYADFPFLTSTRLYPEWPVAAMPHVDRQVTAQVASALLAIPHHSPLTQSMAIAGFTIPGDYRTVDNLMRQLRIEPFNESPMVTLRDIYHHWSQELIALILILVSLMSFFILLLYRRNRSLLKAKRHLQANSEQLRKLQLAVEQSPESILITDLQGQITYINPAVEQITGYKAHELMGKNPRIFQSDQTEPSVYQHLWSAIKAGEVWQGEMINRRKSGEDYHVQVVIAPVNNDVGDPMAYLSIQRDISAQKDDQHRMQQLLYVDGLTGLGNRSKLIDTLDKQLQHHKDGLVGYLLLLNIDRFKWVNATHGVAFGDQLLVALAERLNTFIADSGIVVRLEGDKFALLLTTSEQWRKDENWLFGWQNALQSLVTAPFKLGSERINIHCSMGITQIDANHHRSSIDIINTVIAQASTALKLAQKLGGNRLEPFKSEMSDRDLEVHNIELELTSALKHNELRLFVQEQVDEQDKLVGAECLIRWQHPVKGLLAPFAFIGVAEQSDLIIKIGYWVIQDACRILAQAQQQGLVISLSVNISPRHFLQPDFIDNTLAIVQAKGIKPSSLILEITESLFMENLDEVTQKMKQLKAMGFRFSIDDFGTGYSSLSYLKHLPIDELKIDRAFVTAMGEEGLSQSLVETIYAVATKMHLHIVAEGVETQAQSDMLKALPGIIQQGYYHSRPEDADDWLAQKTNKS